MTIQKILKKDIVIIIVSVLLGICLAIIFGKAEFTFGIMGLAFLICAIQKIRYKKRLVYKDLKEEYLANFIYYLKLPGEIIIGIILLYFLLVQFIS